MLFIRFSFGILILLVLALFATKVWIDFAYKLSSGVLSAIKNWFKK